MKEIPAKTPKKLTRAIILIAILIIGLIFPSFNKFLKTKKAVDKVKNLREVQEFLQITKNGLVELDHEDKETNSYVIHVYEIKDNHTATFNWYYVNKATGEITKEFDFSEQDLEE